MRSAEREDLRSIEVSVGGVVVWTDAGAQVSESPKSERGTAKYTMYTGGKEKVRQESPKHQLKSDMRIAASISSAVSA